MTWKKVKGYTNYEVNEVGEIRNIHSGKFLKQHSDKNGYKIVALYKNNVRKTCKVHRLVLIAFVGNRCNLQVNHKNGIKDDNRLENLEWCTGSENRLHAWRTGLSVVKEEHKRKVIRSDGKIYDTLKEAAIDTGCYIGMVCNICRGVNYAKTYKGYSFKYYTPNNT